MQRHDLPAEHGHSVRKFRWPGSAKPDQPTARHSRGGHPSHPFRRRPARSRCRFFALTRRLTHRPERSAAKSSTLSETRSSPFPTKPLFTCGRLYPAGFRDLLLAQREATKTGGLVIEIVNFAGNGIFRVSGKTAVFQKLRGVGFGHGMGNFLPPWQEIQMALARQADQPTGPTNEKFFTRYRRRAVSNRAEKSRPEVPKRCLMFGAPGVLANSRLNSFYTGASTRTLSVPTFCPFCPFCRIVAISYLPPVGPLTFFFYIIKSIYTIYTT